MAVADIIHARDQLVQSKGTEGPWLTDTQLFQVCQFLLAIFWPPLAVFLERGCGVDLCINILLCILMYLPGVLHALWIVYWSEYIDEFVVLSPTTLVAYKNSRQSMMGSMFAESPVDGVYDAPFGASPGSRDVEAAYHAETTKAKAKKSKPKKVKEAMDY